MDEILMNQDTLDKLMDGIMKFSFQCPICKKIILPKAKLSDNSINLVYVGHDITLELDGKVVNLCENCIEKRNNSKI